MSNSQRPLFPIRDLVQRTGVNASTLRAWEHRHGLLTPVRTPSGHRLYHEADVQRVRRLQELLAAGLSLSEIGSVLDGEETDAAPAALEFRDGELPANPAWRGYVVESLRALEDFSTERLDILYNETCALYPIDVVTRQLLLPVLEQLGRRWDGRPSGVAEEHFFTAWLRNKLGARLHHSVSLPRGRPLILACLPQECHEIGLLLCALALLGGGRRVTYLGANMPVRQIVHVVRHSHAIGVVLAGRTVTDPAPILADIAWLVTSSDAPVFIGSHFAVQVKDALEQAGAIPLGNNLDAGLRRLEATLLANVPGGPHRHPE